MTHMLNHITRAAAIGGGGLILYLTAEKTLAHVGQTDGPAADLVRALAVGVALGAIAIGLAWHHRHYVLAFAVALAMIAGEGYALLQTADQTIAQREAAQAKVRAQAAERTQAEARVKKAEAALSKANADSITTSAERHCRKECRTVLERTITDAGLELHAARAAMAAIPAVTVSPTALADRLGWAPWVVDLVAAALASLAGNGLGSALVAFGAHGSVRPDRRPDRPALQVAGRDAPDVPALTSDDPVAAALAILRPSGQPSPHDVLQASYAAMADDAARLAAFLDPNGRPDGAPDGSGPPRGPGRRTKHRTDGGANVIALPTRTVRPDTRRDQVLASLLADLADGRTFGSQAEICEAYDVPRSTLSDWLRIWEADGISFRRAQRGRVKQVARA